MAYAQLSRSSFARVHWILLCGSIFGCWIVTSGCGSSTSQKKTKPPVTSVTPPGKAASKTAIFADDKVLHQFSTSIPKGWTLHRTADRLVVAHEMLVWTYLRHKQPLRPAGMESRYPPNAPILMWLEQHARQVQPRLIYSLEEKWSLARWKRERAHNAKIRHAIDTLPKKYGIEGLRLGTNGTTEIYGARTAKDREAIKNYRRARRNEESRLHQLPVCTGEKYTLLLHSEHGVVNNWVLVYPPASTRHVDTVRDLLARLCGDHSR